MYAQSDIVLNSGDAAEQVIKQITSLNHNQAVTLAPIPGSGGLHPLNHVQTNSKPKSTITTTDTAILALNTNRFLSIGYCADQAASILPLNKWADCNKLDSSAVHVALQASGKVFCIPTSISGQGSEFVQINSELTYLAGPIGAVDNHVSPMSKLTGQALRSATLSETSRFAKAFIRGTEIPECTGFSYSPGLTVVGKADGGGTYDSRVYITAVAASFEFTVEDLGRALDAINATDTTAGGGTIVYLAKNKNGEAVESYASTVHKSITGLAGVETAPTISASEGSNGTGTIKVDLNNPTGANNGDLVTVATGIAIP